MPTNTISDDLQLTRTLDFALRAFRRTILSLTSFATVFRQVQLQGDNTVTVPYYPIATSASQSRAARGSYKALASNTNTQAKKITINRNKVQALSFTSEEVARQPHFDPAMHGTLKGEKLAYDVIADIWSLVGRGRFPSTTIPAVLAANFDENDVAAMGELCETADWPESGRSMLLRPAFGWNVVKQGAIIDASKSGMTDPLRSGMLPQNLLGFQTYRSNGVKTNNGDAVACTASASTDLVTVVGGAPNGAPDWRDGDRVVFATSYALPGGLDDTPKFVRDLTVTGNDVTFKVAATAGGTAINITDAGTGDHTVARAENLAGAALLPSSILAAFAPVPPTEAIRERLHSYRMVNDQQSGAVLEFRHFADPDTDEEVQVIECHYGFDLGETDALKPIFDDSLENPS